MSPTEYFAVWRESFRVRVFEMDDARRLHLPALCNYLQETAAAHANALGASLDALLDRSLTWVLSRFHVRTSAAPLWREEVIVETWPSAVSAFFALRDFRVLDFRGAELATATSSWMIIDAQRRKPVPIPDFIKRFHGENPGRALDDSFPRLPDPGPNPVSRVLEVRRFDLDANRHVNFEKIIEMGLEAVSEEMRSGRRLAGLEIAFSAECVLGDRVVVRAAALGGEEPLLAGHTLHREKDGLELARMRTAWPVDRR